MHNLDNLSNRLVRQIQTGNCVAMIDDNRNMDGFARSLAVECEYAKEDLSLSAVAKVYEIRNGRQRLVSRLRDWMKTHPSSLSNELDLLAQSPITKFVSLDYGSGLEDALKNANRRTARLVTDIDIPFVRVDQVVVIKPFGALDHGGSLIITEDDHRDFIQNKQNLVQYWRELLASHAFVLLNCNLDAKDFQKTLYQLARFIDQRQHKMLVLTTPSSRSAIQRRRKASQIRFSQMEATCFFDILSRLSPSIQQVPYFEPLAPRKRPYKFLDYYEEEDRDLFRGRDEEIRQLVEKILAGPLTVLYGRSGVGKTSLLKAGVIPRLQEAGFLLSYVRIGDDPFQAVKMAALAALHRQEQATLDPSLSLQSFLAQLERQLSQTMIIFIDQFEECFIRLNDTTRETLAKELNNCLHHGQDNVRLVLSLREDFLPDLETMSLHLPHVFQNGRRFRLKEFGRDQASQAIQAPAKYCGLDIETILVETMLDDLNTPDGIAPAQLSIVCDRLYESLRDKQDIKLENYQDLGGAHRILAGYVDHVLDGFDPSKRFLAQMLLKNMVTSYRTKSLIDEDQILSGIRREEREVLWQLIKSRLVRSFKQNEQRYYELAHEYLVDKIQTWIDQEEFQAKAAREMIRRELRAWYDFGSLLETDRLERIDLEQENPHLVFTAEELALLALSAAYREEDAEAWLAKFTAMDAQSHEGVKLLKSALHVDDERIHKATLKVLGRVWNIPQIGQLGDSEEDDRCAAARALGYLGDDRAIEPLLWRLYDPKESVRETAKEALAEMGWTPSADALGAIYWCALGEMHKCSEIGMPAVEPLMRRLQDSNEDIRQAAVEALVQIGDVRIAEPLVDRVRKDEKPSVQKSAAEALIQIGNPQALQILREQFPGWDNDTRQAIVEALGRTWKLQTARFLIEQLHDRNQHIQYTAIEALGWLRDAQAVGPLLDLIKDRDKSARTVVPWKWGWVRNAPAVKILAYQVGYRDVEKMAITALGAIGDKQAAELLTRMLADRARDMRKAAAEALGSIGDAQAVQPLAEKLYDRDHDVQIAAAKALGQIGDTSALEPLLQKIANLSQYEKRTSIAISWRRENVRIVEPIVELIDEQRVGKSKRRIREMRMAIAEALGHLGSAQAVEPLLEMLKWPSGYYSDREFQQVVAESLGQIGDARAVEPLLELAKRSSRDYSSDVAQAAIRALGEIRVSQAVEPLLVLLMRQPPRGHSGQRIQQAVVEALGEISDPRAVKPLAKMLESDIANTRKMAAEALRKLDWNPFLDPHETAYWFELGETERYIGMGASALEYFKKMLKDLDRDVREKAARALEQAGWAPSPDDFGAAYWFALGDSHRCAQMGSSALGLLLEELKSWNGDSAKMAASTLGSIGDSQAVDPLIEYLEYEHRSSEAKRVAIEALGRIGDVAATRSLTGQLHDENIEVRKATVKALAQIGGVEARQVLIERLDNEKKDVRLAVAKALAHFKDPQTVEPLIKQLRRCKPGPLRIVAEMLGRREKNPVLGPLARWLGYQDTEVRLAAVDALGQIGDARAIVPLITMLKDRDWHTRQVVTAALGQLGDTRAVKSLLDGLKSTHKELQIASARALRQIGDPNTVDPILRLLQSQDLELQLTAVEALGWKGNYQAVGPLVEQLEHHAVSIRRTAARSLGRIGNPQGIEPLAQRLQDQHKSVRLAAIEAMGQIGTSQAARLLIEQLYDDDLQIRQASLKTLSLMKDVKSVEPLIECLGDAEHSVRRMAAERLAELDWVPPLDALGAAYWLALGEIDQCVRIGSPAVELLLESLAHKDQNIRRKVVEALGQTGDDQAVERIVDCLEDQHGSVRLVAVETLGQIGDARTVEALLKRLEDQNQDVRRAAIEALRQIGDMQAKEPLLERLRDSSNTVRTTAAAALEQMEWTPTADATGAAYWLALGEVDRCIEIGSPAVDLLVERLGSPDENVQHAAVVALGKIGDDQAVEPLANLLGNDNRAIRQAAVESLLRIGSSQVIDLLIAQLKHSNPDVRQIVADALGQIGSALAADSLAGRLEDRNENVRHAAIEALGKIGDARSVIPLIEQIQDRREWDKVVEQKTLDALKQIGSPAITCLVGQLGEPDRTVRRKAARILKHLEWTPSVGVPGAAYWFELEETDRCVELGSIAVPLLIQRLKDPDWIARLAAANLLERVQDSRATEPLIERLWDENDIVCGAAATALRQMRWNPSADASGAAYWFALRDTDNCATIGAPAVEFLIKRLHNQDKHVRQAAVEVLGRIGDSRAVEPLVVLVREQEQDIRQAAAQALRRLGNT